MKKNVKPKISSISKRESVLTAANREYQTTRLTHPSLSPLCLQEALRKDISITATPNAHRNQTILVFARSGVDSATALG